MPYALNLTPFLTFGAMYYIVFGLLYVVSLLPFRVLFVLSDLFAFILYYIIGYRKKVVFSNLAMAFPGKTTAERKKIAKKFYRHFTDNWIEALKMISISEKAIMKRISLDFKAFHDVREQGRCCHMLMGHTMNWEWGQAALPVGTGFKCLIAYAPISSRITDRLFLYLRQRFGCILLPFNDMRRAMMPHRHSQYLLALVADQNPSNPLKSYWLPFLGVRTGFLQGPEKGARIGNIPVVFMGVTRTRRGYYHMKAVLLENNPASLPEGELTRRYVAILEEEIRSNPSAYLWSHKRWKHAWKEDYAKLWIGN
jgi:Kdo2-lipid IVA lauroyltransferase/acyltransferase